MAHRDGIPEMSDANAEPAVTAALETLANQTRFLARYHYNPEAWLSRAFSFEQLGYPELAASDIWKSHALCLSLLQGHAEYTGFRLGHQMGFWMREEHTNPSDEEANVLQARLLALRVVTERLRQRFESREYVIQPYPWLLSRHQHRSDELVEEINQELAVASSSTVDYQTSCIVKRCTFEDKTEDGLGVFAIHEIEKGKVIVQDETRVWGCNGPGQDRSLGALSGCRGCAHPLHPNAESDGVARDLSWIRDRAQWKAADVLVLIRALLCCIEDEVSHPLDHPIIARLTSSYHAHSPVSLSIENDIQIPNEALQQFGCDIFANLNFDGWVLFTIAARLDNNVWSDPISTTLSPLFCLFNHSCEPNVSWTSKDDHTKVVMKATKDIEPGEQLYIEYDSFMHDQPLQERRRRLGRWIEGGCRCTRCEREELEQELACLRGVHGSSDDGQIKKASRDAATWDQDDKPMLPEDLSD